MVDSWYIDSEDGRYPVETVIVKDLITHVDATRRTIAKKDGPHGRRLFNGRIRAMRLGLKYPEAFGAVGAMVVRFGQASEPSWFAASPVRQPNRKKTGRICSGSLS